MLSRLLDQWGLFLGLEKDQNHESLFFQRTNEWMFFQANASWDCPDNMRFIDQPLKSLLEKGVRYLLSGNGRIQYLGKEKSEKYQDISDIDFPWAWKDPRNIFTIDVWKTIFPTARLIHICRDAGGVANSIRAREQQRFAAIEKHIDSSGVEQIIDQGEKFRTTVRCLDIHEGIKLWKAYEEKAASVVAQWAPPALSIRYEDLLANPLDVARRIADFAQISPTDILMKKTLAKLDKNRRFAFLKSKELLSVYEGIQSDKLVQKLGYNSINHVAS